jgi:LssY C-terminus
MSRNHLRVWKSPHQVDGRPLWCVAATHDIGFERNRRNNGLPHKIDPAKTTGGEFHSDGRILVLVLNSADAENQ